jgi:hypothetical protein
MRACPVSIDVPSAYLVVESGATDAKEAVPQRPRLGGKDGGMVEPAPTRWINRLPCREPGSVEASSRIVGRVPR